MGKKLSATLVALYIAGGCILPSATASAQSQTGPALVGSSAPEILLLRPPSTKSRAWVFTLQMSTTRSDDTEPVKIVITVSDDDYTAYETETGLSVVDHKLKRLFNYDKESKTFSNGSISEAPAFAVWEWQHRATIVQMNSILLKDGNQGLNKLPLVSDPFWISHDLGIKLPNADDDGARIERDQDNLRLSYRDEEVALLTFGEKSAPRSVIERVWGVVQRIRPIHPALVAQAIDNGAHPKSLKLKLFDGEKPYWVELTFDAPAKANPAYPLPKNAVLRYPRAGEASSELMDIARRAALGEFSPGTPDEDYWVARFQATLAGDQPLETFLTFYAHALFVADFRWADCAKRKNIDNKELCTLVRKAQARSRGQARIGELFQFLQPPDEKAKIFAIRALESFRGEAGEMAPLLSLFIANHIEDVTQTITRSSGDDGRPNRDDATALYLEALQEFPFIRSIYGDIGEYYMNFFAADRAYFFADIGRSIPLDTKPLENGNLAKFSRIEQSMRNDFPVFY